MTKTTTGLKSANHHL